MICRFENVVALDLVRLIGLWIWSENVISFDWSVFGVDSDEKIVGIED